MLYTVVRYFLLFYIYSVVGYLCEVFSIYLKEKEFLWNRGYLLGPYLPVFGFGSLIITLFLQEFQSKYLTLFIMGMVYCATLEYLTSYILEKIYHVRWWDYSEKKYNINGRISLETSVFFGIASIIIINITNPIIYKGMNLIKENVFITLGIVIFIIFFTDFIISTKEIVHLRGDLKLIEAKDATEEIKNKMIASIQKHFYYYDRLLKAFPNVKHTDARARQVADMIKRINSRGREYVKERKPKNEK